MSVKFRKYGVRIPTDSGRPVEVPDASAGLEISVSQLRDANGSPIQFAYVSSCTAGMPSEERRAAILAALTPISEAVRKAKGTESPPSLVQVEKSRHGTMVTFTDLEIVWQQRKTEICQAPDREPV